MSERSDKLCRLRDYMDLVTGEWRDSKLVTSEENWYLKSRREWLKGRCLAFPGVSKRLRNLNEEILDCQKCPGMNIIRISQAAPGWGRGDADVLIAGQSLHKAGMMSGVPFVGGSGQFVVSALWLSGLKREDCRWCNTTRCFPERDRFPGAKRHQTSDREKENCTPYLLREIEIVEPRVVLAFGNDAKDALKDLDCKVVCMKHPASMLHGDSPPEDKYNWIVKLSLEIDRCLK